MIIYDLKCKKNHKFEGWFKDNTAFEEQKKQNLITCPVCGESDAEVVPSSLDIMGRDMKLSKKNQFREPSPRKGIQQFNEYLDKNFDDVGENLPRSP